MIQDLRDRHHRRRDRALLRSAASHQIVGAYRRAFSSGPRSLKEGRCPTCNPSSEAFLRLNPCGCLAVSRLWCERSDWAGYRPLGERRC
jgi:hypothetical protein